jgi:intracellular sulfur oxidation DsrE/DsrF family protein
MNQALAATLAATVLAGCASMAEPGRSGAGSEMKMAFDVTDTNPVVLGKKLEIIEVTRKQLIDAGAKPQIVVAFRGNASFFTQTNLSMVKENERADALKVRAQIRELARAPGVVAIEQCNLPLAERKLKAADLMQEVKLVPNGWIALTQHQRNGYAYIAP